MRVLLLVMSSAAWATLVARVPAAAPYLAFAAVVLASLTVIVRFHDQASTYAAAAEEFSRILNEYRELWRDIDSYRVTEDDATERLRTLKERSVIATRPLMKSRVNNRELMQCHEAAARVVRHARSPDGVSADAGAATTATASASATSSPTLQRAVTTRAGTRGDRR